MNNLSRAKAEADKWANWYFSDKKVSLDEITKAKTLFIENWLANYKVK